MNTGFKTARCPEFLNWIEHDQALNGHSIINRDRAAPVPMDSHFLEYVRWMHKKKSKAFYNLNTKTFVDEYIQQKAIPIAYEGFKLSQPGSEARNKLVKFLETESLEDTKTYFNSLNEYPEMYKNQLLKTCLTRIHTKLKFDNLFLESSSLVYELLFYMQKLQELVEANTKSDFGAKLIMIDENTDLDVAYQWWTECVNNDKENCSKVIWNVAIQQLSEKKVENLEFEYEASKLSGKRFEVPLNYSEGKLGLIKALRAYIVMRNYFDRDNLEDLKKNSLSALGFSKMPADCKSLNISTYTKNSSLHRNLVVFFQLSSYRIEWTSFDAILLSMNENRKIIEAAEEKKSALLLLENILERCMEKETYRIDPVKNRIICTREHLFLELERYSNLKDELETYCLEILSEAIQSDDLTKLIKRLDTELKLIACNLKVSICDDLKQFHSSSGIWTIGFDWVDMIYL